ELEHARFAGAAASGEPASVELLVRGTRAPGQVTMVFDAPVSEWHVGVVTPERGIDLDLFRDIVMTVGSDEAHRPFDILRTSTKAVYDHAAGFASSGARYAARRLFWGHDALIARFVRAVRDGGPSPVPPEESVGIVRLTDAVLAQLT